MENLHFDDNAITELVSTTHNPDGRDFDINVALSVAENILNFETATDQEATEEKLKELDLNYKDLPLKIRQLCLEIASKWLSTIDGHLTTISLLSTLSTYPWEAKLVLMLVAFSISYGKLNIISRLCYKKGLAKQLAFVTQITNPTATSDKQNPLDDSIKHALDLTRCIVEIKQSPSYSLPQSVISTLPIASYWIGRSVATNTAYCASLHVADVKFQNERNVITTKIKDILATFCPALEAKEEEESYKVLQHALFTNSSNIVEVLKLILNVKDENETAFFRMFKRETTKLKFFRLKKVVLLITSGLDISKERIQFLNSFFLASSLLMLWTPIVDDHIAWTTEQFEELVVKMRFESVDNPQKRIAQRFTRFVKENLFPTFQIGEEPIIISLDKQGRIIHTNAMHMMLTWDPHDIEGQAMRVQKGDNILPFIKIEMKERTRGLDSLITDIDESISHLAREVNDKINAWSRDIEAKIQQLKYTSSMYTSEREITLWQKEKAWSLGLVVGNTDNTIKDWIIQESYIFLYGGNDIKWVREFTSKVHEVSSKTRSNIQLAYAGKNDKIRANITEENMSDLLLSSYHVWWFWTRLQSSYLSRINYLNATSCDGDECNDEIALGFKYLLAYESERWALLSKGQKVIVCGYGAKMLRVMNEYQNWTKNMAPESFDQAFKDYYKMLSSCSFNNHPYCSLEYPTSMKEIIENEKCPECSCHMKKFITFTCYHGDS